MPDDVRGAGFDLEHFLPYQLNRLVGLLNAGYQRKLHRRKMTLNHWRVLAALQAREPLMAGELARVAVVDQTTLSRLLVRMEENGLVRRATRPDDARFLEVTLTERGREEFQQVRAIALREYERLFSGLPQDDVERLSALVGTVIRHLEQG
ncbi:MAG TPA: MarR family transcriptional regulator [Azospirillum sp.]|nr:MarR family transcriptional regulator [Azospirillum sp.]